MKNRHEQLKGKQGHRDRQKGMIMIAAVVMLAGLMFIATTSSLNSLGTAKVETTTLDETRTFYAAEAAIEWGTGELKQLLQTNLDPSEAVLDSLPYPNMDGYTYDLFDVTQAGPPTQEIITAGDYMGLIGFVTRYNITARAQSGRTSTTLNREVQHQFIPLFQFGVFYDEDLEIFPGPQMTFEGRIHTNADLYMGCDNSIFCNSYVTSGGQYWHHRKDGGHVDPSGSVNIKDQLGAYKNVWRGSYWLDNRQANWATESLSLWGGQVRDRAHGMTTLRLPLPPAADQHEIVERGDTLTDGAQERESKYWYKAGIRWVDGVCYDSTNNVVATPAYFTYTVNKFYDDRENKWMDVVEINVSRMIADSAYPANRIIYVSDHRPNDPAVRIKNATTLPLGGLTIATDLPLYVQGNYNTTAKKGSALLCDAITFLSPSWNDANSSLSLSNRTPSNMSVNACIMTGHVPSVDGGGYSGGLENLLRFLENWSGKTVTYRGSMIDLWFSRYATTNWSYGSYYTAPNRNWGFDTDLLDPDNWPPGTPKVHTVQRGAWRQIS